MDWVHFYTRECQKNNNCMLFIYNYKQLNSTVVKLKQMSNSNGFGRLDPFASKDGGKAITFPTLLLFQAITVK